MSKKVSDLTVEEFTELITEIIDRRIEATESDIELVTATDLGENFLSEDEIEYYLHLEDVI